MIRILSCLLFAVACQAGQSLVLNGASGKATIPPGYVYLTVGDMRVELRMHGSRSCSQNGAQVLHIPRTMVLRCSGNGATYQLHDFAGTRSFPMPAGDVILRIQRDPAAGWWYLETWSANGTGYANHSFASGGARGTKDTSSEDFTLLGSAGTSAEIAWIRWYSGTIPRGGPMPANHAPAGDLGNWRFDGDTRDDSGNGIDITMGDGAFFVGTPVYPPLAVVTTTHIRAGAASELDGTHSSSFAEDPQGTTYEWRQVSGPTTLIFDDPRRPKPVVRGAVAGAYTVELTVTDSGGQSSTATAVLRSMTLDLEGVQILPTNLLSMTPIEVEFELRDGAHKARITVLKADGRSLPHVICTESPCSVMADPRFPDHHIRIELLDEHDNAIGDPDLRLVSIEAIALARRTPPGYNRMGIVNYGTTSGFLGNRLDRVLRFISDKYDIFLSGANPLVHNPEVMSLAYRDMAALYPYEMPELKRIAEKHGYNFEDILLHMNVNHTFGDARYAWSGMDRFDVFDRGPGGVYRNGVLLLEGSTYTDRTTAAYDNNPADVPVRDKVLIACSEPFDEINFTLSTPASGVAVSWEYWNGSFWAPLTLASDGTNGLTQSGRIRFFPPADWKRRSENGSLQKWWVRAAVSGSGTTPVASRILGDDWSVPGQRLTWRGWDANSPTRINVGLGPLEYNPTPPENATARFRHQARLLGLWANNLSFANLANIQNGERTWVRYLVEASLPEVMRDGRNGIFFDDGTATPNALTQPSGGWQRSTEAAGLNYFDEQIETYKAARDYLRTFVPDARVGINNSVWDMIRHGDMFLVELTDEVHKGGIYYYNVNPNKRWWSSGTYDQLLPENNPGGTKGVYATWDTRGSDFVWNGDFVIWDRGNRSPVTALAAYYIVANENTRFNYNVEGWSYSKADQFYHFGENPDFAIDAPIEKDLTTGTQKSLTGDFRNFPANTGRSVVVRIGDTGEYLPVTKSNDNRLVTTDVIGHSYPAGTPLYLVREGNLAIDPLPPVERIYHYCNWFPAVGIDIGEPDPNGYNGGRRNMTWKSAAEAGTHNAVQRRDYTRAIVLHASGANAPGAKFAQYGNEIELDGTYYPLRSDGTTGAGITSIRLRTGEGAILMKEPVF